MKCKMGFGTDPHHHGCGKWKHQKHFSDNDDDNCQMDGHDHEHGPCKRGHGHGPGPHKHGHGHGPHKHGHAHGPHKHGHKHGPHKHGHGPDFHKDGHDDGNQDGHDHGHHMHGHGHHMHGHGHHIHGHGHHMHGHGHHKHGHGLHHGKGPGHDHGHGPHKHGHGHHHGKGPGHDHGHGHSHHSPLDFLLPHFGQLGGMHRGGRGGHFGYPFAFGRGGRAGHHFGRGGLAGHGMRGGHFGHRGHHGRRGRHFGCGHPEQNEIDPEILCDQMIDMVDDGMLQFGCYLSSLNQDAQDNQQHVRENCEDCEANEPVTVDDNDATNSEQMYTTTVTLGQGVKPSGIKISLKGYVLTVEGKIEETSDDGNFTTYEEFTKRVTLPDNVKKEEVKTVLLPDGVLKVQAPMVTREGTEATSEPTEVPIVQLD